jgi:hypothetical protein
MADGLQFALTHRLNFCGAAGMAEILTFLFIALQHRLSVTGKSALATVAQAHVATRRQGHAG